MAVLMTGSSAGGWTVILLLTALLTIGACEFQRDPVGIELKRSILGIYSVLVAGESRPRVLVLRFSKDRSVQDSGVVPVDDAEVRVVRDGEETTLAPTVVEECIDPRSLHLVQEDQGCYTGDLARPIAAGNRFELRVRFADGEEAHGTTVIPGALTVESPNRGDTLWVSGERYPKHGNLLLELGVPPDAALIEVGVISSRYPTCQVGVSRSFPGDVRLKGGRTVRLEPSEAEEARLAINALCADKVGNFISLGEFDSTLRALAYDTTYARWVDELAVDGQNLPWGRASAGLEGAVGYFAAANPVRVPVQVREESKALPTVASVFNTVGRTLDASDDGEAGPRDPRGSGSGCSELVKSSPRLCSVH